MGLIERIMNSLSLELEASKKFQETYKDRVRELGCYLFTSLGDIEKEGKLIPCIGA